MTTTQHRIAGFAVLLLGALLLFALIPVGVDSPNAVPHITLSPAFWPKIISVLLILMGVLLIVRPAAAAAAGDDDGNSGGNEDGNSGGVRRFARLAITLFALFAFYGAIEPLGMVLPAILLIMGLTSFAGERRFALITLVSVAVPIALYFFFEHVAGVPIPLGVFEGLKG